MSHSNFPVDIKDYEPVATVQADGDGGKMSVSLGFLAKGVFYAGKLYFHDEPGMWRAAERLRRMAEATAAKVRGAEKIAYETFPATVYDAAAYICVMGPAEPPTWRRISDALDAAGDELRREVKTGWTVPL